MKKVITTVGTSVFTNYFDEEKNNNIDSTKKTHYAVLKNKPFSELENFKDRIKKLKPVISDWVKNNEDASAEIKSLKKIRKHLKNNLDVYLFASDTILSNIAAEIIKEYFKENEQISIKKIIPIKKLQVFNAKEFSKEGLINLISKIENIANKYYENVIFNITGGYKAVIPYMTIMAQINQCDIYYIFEDTDTLIKIPKTPIRVDYDEIEKNYSLLKKLENGTENYSKWKNLYYEKIKQLEGFIEADVDTAFLSPIGQIFLSKYEQKYFVFYAPEDVWTEIEQKEDIKRTIETKFCFEEQRKSQTESKNQHFVFDDGKNSNRIFYFEENNNIYIYKVFTNHDKYEKYLNTNRTPNIEKIKKESKIRKLEKRMQYV